ncbi:hypothetical protein F5884DRAFT_892858 [Xylogone sp. PMI_703]|nr:hypothetical protein F5884DRAFT_892858 [Xylogone sp. PMI_703]
MSSDDEEKILNDIVAQITEHFFIEFGIQVKSLIPHTELQGSISDTKIPVSQTGTPVSQTGTPVPKIKPPESVDEYREYTWNFIRKNLTSFYKPNDPFVEEIIQRAAVKAKEYTAEYDLEPEVTPKLIIMALYDFVILCDDSGSMKKGSRIKTLEETCIHIAQIATLLQPEGISLRFLNSQSDQDLNLLTKEDDIRRKMKKVTYYGPTQLGTVLRQKIVQPLIIDKIISRQLKRPIITVVITDGCPYKEDPHSFKRTIRSCKNDLTTYNREPASAIFLISRVGDAVAAENFLKQLQQDDELNGMLYCCLDQLDDMGAVFQTVREDRKYSSFLIKLFEAALDSQTEQ